MLNKTYEPKRYESKIYESWEKSGAFKPTGKGKPFSIIMPPPNANGALHWGHAVGYTLEDIIIRFKRMQGYRTLWLPGTDHAGIETQYVYERDILAAKGQDRFSLGRDNFYEAVMKFTRQSEATILAQMRSMGYSADWSKLKFTLDSDIVAIVYDTFKRLHEDGLIYRGNRLVNWCPRCMAAFADIEIEHPEHEGTMYTLDYGPLKVATVRPETIFADVAVAVNPKDKRYQKLIGKEAIVPLSNRSIPIITDPSADPQVGTGALKITPGHDATDYEIGRTHNLPEISVIDTAGKLINVPEEFAGLKVEAGRAAVVKALKAAGKLVKTSPIRHNLAVHDRCKTIIEPLLSEQWFLRVKALNQPVVEALKTKAVKVFPERFTKVAIDWLEAEHDWCISRQIWWGIRLPVFYKTSNDPKKQDYLISADEAEAAKYYGNGNYRAETDTFDTWFSSSQWPFATLLSSGDFDTFYPTSVMATAREILHKWVTRMMMLGLYRTNKAPFKDIYLWGLVTDEHGHKMSKSKGNVIDPLKMTAKYGTDALRLAGALSNTPGNNSPMSEDRIRAQRNFCNKLWNVARFVLDKSSHSEREAIEVKDAAPKPISLADRWLLGRLAEAVDLITAEIEGYRLNQAANRLYHLLWDDFADWYIETSKLETNPALLNYALRVILKLAHPFVPFVSEAIWRQMPNPEGLLINSPWPRSGKTYPKAIADFSHLQAMISELRALKHDFGLKRPTLYYSGDSLLEKNATLIKRLAGLGELSQQPGGGLPLLSNPKTYLAVESAKLREYRRKVATQLVEQEHYLKTLETRLKNVGFLKSAPEGIIRDTQDKWQQAKQELASLRTRQAQANQTQDT